MELLFTIADRYGQSTAWTVGLLVLLYRFLKSIAIPWVSRQLILMDKVGTETKRQTDELQAQTAILTESVGLLRALRDKGCGNQFEMVNEPGPPPPVNGPHRTQEHLPLPTKTHRALGTAVVFALALLCAGDSAAEPVCLHAVVRIPSHGCSGTIIYTAKDKTLILSCAHAFQGKDLARKLKIDIPIAGTPPRQVAPARVLDVQLDDTRGADCTLILLPAGPMPYCTPVAPQGFRPSTEVYSVGYRRMVDVSIKVHSTLVGRQVNGVQFTRERPVPGDSGGGLIDAKYGLLFGTTIGYETRPNGRGMYTSLSAIHEFLARQKQTRERTERIFYRPPAALCPPSG